MLGGEPGAVLQSSQHGPRENHQDWSPFNAIDSSGSST
jgi:hypothetical protein